MGVERSDEEIWTRWSWWSVEGKWGLGDLAGTPRRDIQSKNRDGSTTTQSIITPSSLM